VTRHGMDHTQAAAIELRLMAHVVLNVVNCDPRRSFNHHCTTTNRRAVHQYCNEITRQICNGDGRTVLRIG
jgi:hypothetical protein